MPDTDTPPSPGQARPTRPDQPRLPWWARDSVIPVIDPRQVRARSLRGTLGIGALTLVLGVGLLGVLRGTEVSDAEPGPYGSLAYRQTRAALIGGCGPRYVFSDTDTESGTIPPHDAHGNPNRVTYEPTVPVYGHFWDAPAPTEQQRVWRFDDQDAPQPENLLANQWRGQVVIYYTHDAPPADVDRLALVARTNPGYDAVVAPWPADRDPLPGLRKFAFAAWNASQTCHRFALSALTDFRDAHPAHLAPGADGTEPPPAPVGGVGSAVVGSDR